MLRGRDYTQRVDVYTKCEVVDSYKKVTTTFTFIGTYPAAVRVLSGTKALYYQERGIQHPVEVEMRSLEREIGKIVWQGKEIYPSSVVNSRDADEINRRDRGKFIIISGGFRNG